MSTPLEEKWDERHRRERFGGDRPSPFLLSLQTRLPREGRVLDVGGGAGRNGILLARRGLRVTVADLSRVALERAHELARRAGTEIDTLRIDLEREPFPAGPWAVVLNINFLTRAIFPRYRAELAPGGMLIVSQPTVRNLERHPRPPRPFLLEPNEILELCRGLEIEHHREAWTGKGRHEAHLLARRPAAI